MKALSINQPWAWMIVYGGKDIENRVWKTNFRGEFLIHAGKKYDKEGEAWLLEHFPDLYMSMVQNTFSIKMGGVIGKATMKDCVDKSDSPWFFGPYGFILDNVQAVPFKACRGMLNFFEPKYA